MKSYVRHLFTRLLTACVLALSSVNAMAQGAAEAVAVVAESAVSLTWQQALIPVLTPLVIAGVKWLVPSIPKAWLPLSAPVIGLLIDVVTHFAAGTAMNPTVALVLGAAGVGLREAKKQLTPPMNYPPGA